MTGVGRQAPKTGHGAGCASTPASTTACRRPLPSIFFLLSALVHGGLLAAWSTDRAAVALSTAPLVVQLETLDTPSAAAAPLPTPKEQPRARRRQTAKSDAAPAGRDSDIASDQITANRATNLTAADDEPSAKATYAEPPASAPMSLQALLTARLAHFFEYPRLARQRGWQGQVVLRVHITGDGRLRDIRVGETSGFAVLDRSATQSLAQVGNVREATSGLPRQGIDIELPVIYRLTPGS